MSDWSSDVCSSDLEADLVVQASLVDLAAVFRHRPEDCTGALPLRVDEARVAALRARYRQGQDLPLVGVAWYSGNREIGAPKSASLTALRSEEHTSELQSLMRISYAVFCLKKKKNKKKHTANTKKHLNIKSPHINTVYIPYTHPSNKYLRNTHTNK